ncbi:MAG: DNA repair protein RadA [Deltaproteobacteria bacterium]|nr:DNA repair protein RadA [Deltaproteobacteria bacterium]
MKKTETIFECQLCGYQTPKWMGRCPDCGKWDCFVENSTVLSGPARRRGVKKKDIEAIKAVLLDSKDIENIKREKTGINELDRTLGGGITPGSLILLGGDPGIGKSTLMLQVLYAFSNNGNGRGKVLYISGEESTSQIRLRSKRLGLISSSVFAVSEIDIDIILSIVEKVKPDIMVIDSIQTMFNKDISSVPGSVIQVRETAARLMIAAKKSSVSIFLIGHVTKEGAIAGPKLLEHMVDTVLYFEGDKNYIFRILRVVKNRFGSANEIGVFEMREKGLCEVSNPSALFLSQRPKSASGSVVIASLEGTRPILIEIQALVSATNFGSPRRTILGLDHNRVALLAAVMEKRLGTRLIGSDIFMNVTGGIKIDEPAVDLGIIAAIASSYFDKPVRSNAIAIGEIGLTGEVRAVSHIDIRIAEAVKMGFNKFIIPAGNLKRIKKQDKNINIVGVSTIAEAVDAVL